MVDEELSSAICFFYRTRHELSRHPSRFTGEELRETWIRFRVEVGEERSPILAAQIRSLAAEVSAVRDPGGPISRYGEALDAWAATHPELSTRAVWALTMPLLHDAR